MARVTNSPDQLPMDDSYRFLLIKCLWGMSIMLLCCKVHESPFNIANVIAHVEAGQTRLRGTFVCAQ